MLFKGLQCSLRYFSQIKLTHYTMKKLFNFTPILIHCMCIAATLFLASSCSDNKTVDSKEVAEQQNIAKVSPNDQAIVVIDNDNDAEFLMEAAEMQLEKINLGKLAQQKGSSASVKELGKMMQEDHTKVLTELKALAQSKSVSIPTSITEDSKDAYKNLADKTGNDFGKAYSDMMVEHHEDAIELFEKASTQSKDPNVRSWASQKLPSLKAHLQHAETCKVECDKMKS